MANATAAVPDFMLAFGVHRGIVATSPVQFLFRQWSQADSHFLEMFLTNFRFQLAKQRYHAAGFVNPGLTWFAITLKMPVQSVVCCVENRSLLACARTGSKQDDAPAPGQAIRLVVLGHALSGRVVKPRKPTGTT
jgi:hypothetical protein